MEDLKIKKRWLVPLLGSIGFVLFYRLDHLPLYFEEPRRALVALEMILSGNYWIPKINGFDYFNKPPVYNWILVVFFKIFGTEEWVVRLPTVLSSIAMASFNFWFFKRKIGKHAALISSLLFLLSAHMLFYFSFQGEIDMTYAFLIYLQVISIYHFHQKDNLWLLFLISYVLTAVGFLMKGFPSIAFQGFTLIGLAISDRSARLFLHPAHYVCGLLAVGIIASYFLIYSYHADPEVFLAQLLNESSRRTQGNSLVTHLLALVKVPLELLKITFPGCLLIVFVRWKKAIQLIRENAWMKYALLFLVSNFWLYWISPGTRDRYLYMFLPFIYNLIVFSFFQTAYHNSKALRWTITGLLVMFALALGISNLRFENVITISIVLILGLSVLIYLIQKNQLASVWALILSMIVMRMAYDNIVFPDRKRESKDISGYFPAQHILELVGDQPLYFHNLVNYETKHLPLRGEKSVPVIARLPYDLTFYYSREKRQLIQFTEEPVRGAFHLIHWKRPPENAEVVYRFHHEKWDWILYWYPE